MDCHPLISGGHMGPPLRLKGTTLIIRTVPLIRHASRDTFPQGKAILHRERWLGQARRRCGTAPAAIFHTARALWPGRNRGMPLRFCAPEIFCLTQGITPVMGPGESSPMDLGEAKRSRSPSAASPAAFWVISLVPPGEAQRSGFAGKRRSKGTSAVFATRRKRSRVDSR